MSSRPLVTYEPNPLLGWLYQRFFAHIEVDEAWAARVRAADSRGTVVYVLRSVSFVDFFALDHLTKRLKLPRVRFANDLGLWVLEPMGRGWLEAMAPKDVGSEVEDLKRAVESGASAVLFLKRPPGVLDAPFRGRSEGDPFLRALFEVQRTSKRPILLVPQVFVWSKFPDQKQRRMTDVLLGPREWPGRVRTFAQFAANYRHVTLRAGEPVDLKTFLEQESAIDAARFAVAEDDAKGRARVDSSDGNEGVDSDAEHDASEWRARTALVQSVPPPAPSPEDTVSDDVLVRRLVYVLLRRLERERRAVIGPGKKSRERVREEVLRSPKLQRVLHDMAGEGDAERRTMAARALTILRELEADLDMNTVAVLDTAFDQTFARMFTDIEIDRPGLEKLRAAMKDGVVILLPSHKSHLDYLVLSYVLYTNHIQLPLIAAGDNLNFFPVGAILRNGGAFFIRRSFKGDRLYGAVVDAYIRRLLLDGWPIEFFLEGGRSRTGKLLPPKVGLLNMIVEAAQGADPTKVFFAPISIGYERMVEEDAYIRELAGGEKKKEDVRGLFSALNVLVGRYGRINVQFGELLTLDQVRSEMSATSEVLSPAKRRGVVMRVAYRVMNEINHVTAVTPGSLVGAALLTHGMRGISYDELLAASRRLAAVLHGFGARFSPSLAHPALEGNIRDDAVREACELFARAGHLEVRLPGKKVSPKDYVAVSRQNAAAIFIVRDDARMSLELAKNAFVHFFVARALVATALPAEAARGEAVSTDAVRDRVQFLSRLFKFEFQFRADAPFAQIFEETLAEMVGEHELACAVTRPDHLALGSPEGQARLRLHAAMVRSFVEGYRLAARAVTTLARGSASAKELVKRAFPLGDKMFLAGELELREAISRPVLENAFEAFVDLGYLTREGGRYTLAESYATPKAVNTIEARIASFVLPR